MQTFLIDEDLDNEYLGIGGGNGCGGLGSGGGGDGGGDGGYGDGGGRAMSGAGAGTSNAYGPDTLRDGKNGGFHRQCMAVQYNSAPLLVQCKNDATMVFEPEDERPAGQRKRHVVCVCTVHGEGSFAVLQRTDQRYPVRQLDDLRVIGTAIRLQLGKKQEEFRQCLRMTAEQARKYTSATDWCALQRELQKKKPADSRYRCAHDKCSAVPKRFYAQRADDSSGERQGNEVDLICVCGKPGCNAALDGSSAWKLVYTHESLRRWTRQRDRVDMNMEAFKRWADAAP